MVVLNIYGCSVWNLLEVPVWAPSILRTLLHFWKICVSLCKFRKFVTKIMKSYLWLQQVNLSGICHTWKHVIASEGRLWPRSLYCFVLLHQCGSLLTSTGVSEQPCITLASSTPKFSTALHFSLMLPFYWRSVSFICSQKTRYFHIAFQKG
jgi:hypothetical protein